MDSPKLCSLPVEVLHYISGYLSVRDVLACSLTCHYLRSSLNDNFVWKKYLAQKDFSSLESQQQLVKPALQLEQTLSPLCENRIHYIRRTRLLNNWKEGNCVIESAEGLFEYANEDFIGLKGEEHVIFKDRYLFLARFLNNVESDTIEVWDIGDFPVLHTLLKMDNNKDYDHFFIFGDYLVVLICYQVYVHEITLPGKEFPLKYSFLITEDDVTFHNHRKHTCRLDLSCTDWSHSSVDQYLISNKSGSGACVLHIWDILNAVKKGTFVSPVNGFSISFYSQVGNDWVLSQNTELKNDMYYFYFNIEKGEFCENFFRYSSDTSHIIFHLTSVLLFEMREEHDFHGLHDTVCKIFDFKTSALLNMRRFNNKGKNLQLHNINVIDGTFIMLCIGGFEVVNAQTLETIEHIECENLLVITHQFNLYDSVFVLAYNDWFESELWDIKNKTRAPKFVRVDGLSQMPIDELGTKLVFFEDTFINVLHFW